MFTPAIRRADRQTNIQADRQILSTYLHQPHRGPADRREHRHTHRKTYHLFTPTTRMTSRQIYIWADRQIIATCLLQPQGLTNRQLHILTDKQIKLVYWSATKRVERQTDIYTGTYRYSPLVYTSYKED